PCATMQVEDYGSRRRLGRDQPFGRYFTGHDGLDVDISGRLEEPFFPLHQGAVSFERSVPIEEGPPPVEEDPKATASEPAHRDVLGRSPREADAARGRRRAALAPGPSLAGPRRHLLRHSSLCPTPRQCPPRRSPSPLRDLRPLPRA